MGLQFLARLDIRREDHYQKFLTKFSNCRDTEQKRTEIYNSKNYGDNIEVNAWQLVHAPIAAGGKFRLVFEATVGTKGEGDIAIDDLTITPECRYVLYNHTN